ncbi:MAG: protein kinase [Candidatus Acidiferrum sp.]
MSEMWKNWEGQVADHKYQLQRYLDSTDHSVLFLAEFHDPEPRQVAVKFVSADFSGKDQQLATWKTITQLNHPNLIQIYGYGICKIEDMDLLYVAMEYAEENLAQVLPHRALTAEETTEMLNSAVSVLVYLHGKDLVHGHIKPSNVLAIGERLRLSSDTIFPAGELREMRRERSAYDAPELPTSPYTAASDVWSLGVTLVEACTQQPAVLPFNENAEPIIPPGLPEPFLQVASETLRRDPKLRWSSRNVAECLNPAAVQTRAVAAGAGASMKASSAVASIPPSIGETTMPSSSPVPLSPLDVPLSKEPAVPLAKIPAVATRQPVLPPLPGRTRRGAATETVALPGYVIPLFAAALGVIALVLLSFVIRHRSRTVDNTVAATSNSPHAQVPQATATPSHAEPPSNPAPLVSQPKPKSSEPETPTASSSNPPTSNDSASGDRQKPASAPRDDGEALDQVMPETSPRALATIRGTVHVGVKVHVDGTGNVSEAVLEAPGPSKYFADISLKAAQQWTFTPVQVDGHGVASDWLIQFGFTNAGAKATVSQIEP